MQLIIRLLKFGLDQVSTAYYQLIIIVLTPYINSNQVSTTARADSENKFEFSYIYTYQFCIISKIKTLANAYETKTLTTISFETFELSGSDIIK